MKYCIKLKLILVAILTLCCTALIAQSTYNKHEYSIELGGGLSGLKYKTTVGSKSNNLGGHIGVGYTYFAYPFLGIHAGAELTLYNSTMKLNELTDRYRTLDTQGVEFEFRSKVSGYKENQYAVYTNIPIMVQYHQKIGTHKFYIGAGGKFGIPIWSRAKSSEMTIQNSGYYNEFEPEYTSQEFLGFGTFNGRKESSSMNLRIAYIAAVELGMKWDLGSNRSVYTGIYVDYALNDVRKDSEVKDFVEYNSTSPRDFKVNSVMNSQYRQQGQTKSFTQKVSPMAIGVKVRFAFGKKPKEIDPPAEEPEIITEPKKDSLLVEVVAPIDSIKPIVIDSTKTIVKKDTTIYNIDNKIEIMLNEKFGNTDIDKFDGDRIDITKLEKDEQRRIVKDSIENNIIKTTTVIEEVEYKKAKNILAGDVHGYAIGSTKLTATMKAELDKMIAKLKDRPNAKITLEGNTCSIGGSAINRRIAWERAEEVRSYMIKQGIDESKISVVSYGKTDPEKLQQNTEENRRQNRRVEVVVTEE